jgi:hypothetical protein
MYVHRRLESGSCESSNGLQSDVELQCGSEAELQY